MRTNLAISKTDSLVDLTENMNPETCQLARQSSASSEFRSDEFPKKSSITSSSHFKLVKSFLGLGGQATSGSRQSFKVSYADNKKQSTGEVQLLSIEPISSRREVGAALAAAAYKMELFVLPERSSATSDQFSSAFLPPLPKKPPPDVVLIRSDPKVLQNANKLRKNIIKSFLNSFLNRRPPIEQLINEGIIEG